MRRTLLFLALAPLAACAPKATATTQASATPVETGTSVALNSATTPVVDASTTAATPTVAATPTPASSTPSPSPHDAFVAWLRARIPAGDRVVDRGADAPPDVLHTVQRGEIPATLAHQYVDLSDVYFEEDYADVIAKSARKDGGFRPGNEIHVPNLVTAPFKSADDERLAWTNDSVRGLYIRGATSTKRMFLFILDQMAKRDINAIVLDAKDYDGPVTYASKVPLAVESGAAKGAPIHDLARVIRFVHQKGIHVIMRVSCFNDEFMAHAHPEMIPLAKWGRPYQIGWLDPNNPQAQDYILAIEREVLEAGADEIELDYVRYPVLGIKGADFHLEEKNLTKVDVIHGFVKRAHAITQEHHVPLSLDLFGVVAQGRRIDIDALGQDMAVLAPDAEAFSPMVYPSHYAQGFYGWDNPGDHPEIVGIGVKGSLEQIANAPKDAKLAVVRPWIQAMDYKTTTYSPKYLSDEIHAADTNGGTGWLMWNPSQEYGYAWAAVPPKVGAGKPTLSAAVAPGSEK